MKSDELRRAFIDYFSDKSHTFVRPSPVVADNDPSLMFTNAGMNQFKDVFLGVGSRPFSRAVNSQVCIRVSGKHNDLEDVGKDATHLTSFEMLGNWSFGDYYKKDAIVWAWEFLTTILKIPKERLVATVFEEDMESLSLWKNETDIDPVRIVTCDAKDNFWEMGATGPCGPCSEIHVDLDDTGEPFVPSQEMLNTERYTELWNLVFIQYNRDESGELHELPEKHVDTGAGLERLASYLQKTYSNYQTDLFLPLIEAIEAITGKAYDASDLGMPHRVLADHVRTLSFGIADNVFPSNEGRGYVLRRLLRRAMRYAKKLDVNEPILYRLVDVVVEVMGGYLTHLETQKNMIKQVIKAEEETFLKTLSAGLDVYKSLEMSLQETGEKALTGEDVFKLYDTYGFPLDLTEVLASESGLAIDHDGFARCLNQQKERSRESTRKKQLQKQGSASRKLSNARFRGLNLHLSDFVNEARGGEARVVSEPEDKLGMARHHSATHLLQQALKDVLGDHVNQAGSLVDSDRLRFDFTHFEALTDNQLTLIESKINEKIADALPVSVKIMHLEDAKALGALALFGEKYDEQVRVVKMGNYSMELCGGTHVKNTSQIETVKVLMQSSIAAGTRRIEMVAGNARVSELESLAQKKLVEKIEKSYHSYAGLITDIFAIDPNCKIKKIKKVFSKKGYAELEKERRHLQKMVMEMKREQVRAHQDKIEANIEEVGQVSFLACFLPQYDMNMLREFSDNLSNKYKRLVLLLGGEKDKKGVFLVRVPKELGSKLQPSGDLCRQIAAICGGNGGGRPDFATGGGADLTKLEAALEQVKKALKAQIS